jgi:26S proteasome regulatory subunit N10
VLVTHTKELGQILAAVHKTSTNLGRTASIPTAIAIAQLALKHRQNKTLRQRVVVFVGSPLEDVSPDAERALVRLAKKLKKNNVALDVVAFGDGIEEAGEGGRSILRTFVETASSSDNSYVLFLLIAFENAVLWNSLLYADITSPSHQGLTPSSPPSSSTRRS